MSGFSGKKIKFIYMLAFLDAHMHIQSGACAPLPIMWCKVKSLGTIKPTRDTTDTLTAIVLGEGGRTNNSTTGEIAAYAVAELDAFMRLRTSEKLMNRYKNLLTEEGDPDKPPVSILFAMTMDMEYAHIAGYDGERIYQEVTNNKILNYYVFVRKSGYDKFADGKKEQLNGKEGQDFNTWKTQINDTVSAVLSNPWRILPLYHYDPRRWNYGTKQDVIGKKRMLPGVLFNNAISQPYAPDDLSIGTWDYPFSQVAGRNASKRPGVFIGFKMYTTQGYRPLDEKCPNLIPFYAKCAREGIPIVTHCSPGGNTIPEQKYYMEYLRSDSRTGSRINNEDIGPSRGNPDEYFRDNFVHPRAWRKVLEYKDETDVNLSELKINLAHFGADEWGDNPDNSDWIREMKSLMRNYPNVYTDIACFDKRKSAKDFIKFLDMVCNNEQMHKYCDRILFGTDWYMILLVLTHPDFLSFGTKPLSLIAPFLAGRGFLKGKKYGEFCLDMLKMLNGINKKNSWQLWYRFTIINPIKFYFYNGDKQDTVLIENLKQGMKNELIRLISLGNKTLKNQKNEILDKIESNMTQVNEMLNKIPDLECQIK